MTDIFVCIACLSSNIKMQSIENTQFPEFYEKFTNIMLFIDNGIPKTMCYMCYSQLQKCYRFMNMSQKAGKILTKLLSDGIQLTQETVSALDQRISNNLVTTVLQSTSVPSLFFYDKKPVVSPSSSNVYHEEIISAHTTGKANCVKEVQVNMTFKEEIVEQIAIEEEVAIKEEPMDVESELITKQECTQVEEEIIIKEAELQNQIEGNKIDLPEVNSQSTNNDKLLTPRRTYTKTKKKKRNLHKKNHLCNNCHMKFTCKSDLMRHMRIHTGEKPFACKSCDKTFAQNGHLIQHMRLHTGEKPYACHICINKAFNRRCNYKTHMRKHFGVPSHKCDLCSSAFHQKPDLKRHMMTHTGEKPFACSTCNMRFSQNCHLTSHVKLHLDEPYICTYCELKFSQKLDLKKHLTKMHGQKIYHCTIQGCYKSFNKKGMLTNHMKAHTEERPYACDKCNKTFKQKGHFTKHNVKVHTKSQSDLQPNATDLLQNQGDIIQTQTELWKHELITNQNDVLQDQDSQVQVEEEYIIP